MVRYVTMKRITQILASILFVITVLTVYIAFDFAINNAVANRISPHKRSLHGHNGPHENIKMTKKRSVSPILYHVKTSNRTIKHNDGNENNDLIKHDSLYERRSRDVKQQLHAKPGSFHKGKTGVKVNKPQKNFKVQRKRSLTTTTTTTMAHRNDKHHLDNNDDDEDDENNV
jgi:hypothetical protein